MSTFKSTANAKAMSKGVKWFAFAIVTLVAIYGDVMFLQLMLPAFPDNWLMKGLACIGAVATALSVILLYIGKNRWFRPGGQMVWAYWFTAIEFTILALNCIVAFAFHQSPTLDWILQIWFYLCPVTPLFSAAGWVLINHLDRDNQELHEDMELEDEQRAAMREYKRKEHEAHMSVLHRTLELKTAYLHQFVDSQEGQTGVKEAAEGFGRQVLSGLAGHPVIPAIQSPTVDSTAKALPDETVNKNEQLVSMPVEPVPATNGNGHSKNGKKPSSPQNIQLEKKQVENIQLEKNQGKQNPMGFVSNARRIQLEKNQVQYTHNKAPTRPWGGARSGAGRPSKKSS